MNISNRISFVGFLITLSALSVPSVALGAASPSANSESSVPPSLTIEARLSRLSEALQARVEQLPAATRAGSEQLLAIGFADGGGRGWVNGGRGGWADGHGGSFANRNAWGNGWADGGGFANWRNY